MATARQFQVTFDCADPERVAAFWAEALDYEQEPPDDGTWSACFDPGGVGPRLYFQRVGEGKVVKNRLHLDERIAPGVVGAARVAAIEEERDRLVALGATEVRFVPADADDEAIFVMRDVEGNEFCLD